MAKKAQKKKMKFDDKILLPIAIFLIKFNLLAVPMYLAIYFNIQSIPLQQLLADSVYTVLKFFGYEVVKDGLVLTLTSGFTITNVEMTFDCLGWKSMYALAALALATPLPNDTRKLKFIIAGVALVAVLNFARIVTTILVFYYFSLRAFDLVHTLLWREGLIVAIVLIWFLWLRSRGMVPVRWSSMTGGARTKVNKSKY